MSYERWNKFKRLFFEAYRKRWRKSMPNCKRSKSDTTKSWKSLDKGRKSARPSRWRLRCLFPVVKRKLKHSISYPMARMVRRKFTKSSQNCPKKKIQMRVKKWRKNDGVKSCRNNCRKIVNQKSILMWKNTRKMYWEKTPKKNWKNITKNSNRKILLRRKKPSQKKNYVKLKSWQKNQQHLRWQIFLPSPALNESMK